MHNVFLLKMHSYHRYEDGNAPLYRMRHAQLSIQQLRRSAAVTVATQGTTAFRGSNMVRQFR